MKGRRCMLAILDERDGGAPSRLARGGCWLVLSPRREADPPPLAKDNNSVAGKFRRGERAAAGS